MESSVFCHSARRGDGLESICSYYLDGTTVIVTDKITQSYDDYNRLSSVQYVHRLGSSTYNYTGSFVYDTLGRVVSYTENGFATAYTYLPMGMLDEQTVTNGSLSVDTAYSYEESAASGDGLHELTGRVSGTTVTVTYSSTQKSQNAYTFTYDAAGNITAIRVGGVLKLSYEYDNLNQLTRENNAYTSKTYVYTYDNAGNIVSKKTYAYTTGTLGSVQSTNTYTYGNTSWGDQLTAFNGISFTYDALGNPLQYYNGTSYMFTWTKGRQLSKTVNGSVTTTYTYNSDGIRTGKTVGGVAVEYVLDGVMILAEKHGDNVIRYFYDASGSPVGMIYGSTTYLYEKNLQGDIVAMWTTSGVKVASYVYDAWGNIVSESVMSSHQTASDLNPFRYRGYYYDRETGFYYLQSRYYDPTTGRFLNADGYVSTGQGLTGFNMYAYCGNNPVMNVDYMGEAWYHWVIGAVIVGACAVATVVTCGGFAAAATAVCMVGNGVAAATTASTIAAASFIGSATVYGTAALAATLDSDSIEEFNDHGNWGTVAATGLAAITGGVHGYDMARSQIPNSPAYNLNGSKNENYINKRGWDDTKINQALNNGKQGVSINMSNGASCTVYRYPNTHNQYIVIENNTNSIVQVSNFNDPNWIPDSRIIWYN